MTALELRKIAKQHKLKLTTNGKYKTMNELKNEINGGSMKSNYIRNIIYKDGFDPSKIINPSNDILKRKETMKKNTKNNTLTELLDIFKSYYEKFKNIDKPQTKDFNNFLKTFGLLNFVEENKNIFTDNYDTHFKQQIDEINIKYIETDKIRIKQLLHEMYLNNNNISKIKKIIKIMKIIISNSNDAVFDYYKNYDNELKKNKQLTINNDKDFDKKTTFIKKILDEIYNEKGINSKRLSLLSKKLKTILNSGDEILYNFYKDLNKNYINKN